MLDQIEKALYAEDPKFAQSVRARDPRVHYRRRMIQAGLGFVVGVGLLVAGIITKHVWLDAPGGLIMLVCAMWALTSWRHMAATTAGPHAPVPLRPRRRRRRGGPPAANQAFMERLEERWRRRQERGDT